MKVKTKKNLKKSLDILWALIIAKKVYCEVCGKPGQNAHHVIGRINYQLRWDLRNGAYLCIGDHVFSKDSAHNDPQGFMIWFKSTRPDDYNYLLTKKNDTKTFNILDYQEIYQNLKVIYDEVNP